MDNSVVKQKSPALLQAGLFFLKISRQATPCVRMDALGSKNFLLFYIVMLLLKYDLQIYRNNYKRR